MNSLLKDISLRYKKTDRGGCTIAAIISTIVRAIIESKVSGFSRIFTENSNDRMTGQVTDGVGRRGAVSKPADSRVRRLVSTITEISMTGYGTSGGTFSPRYSAASCDSYHVKCLVIVNPISGPSETSGQSKLDHRELVHHAMTSTEQLCLW